MATAPAAPRGQMGAGRRVWDLTDPHPGRGRGSAAGGGLDVPLQPARRHVGGNPDRVPGIGCPPKAARGSVGRRQATVPAAILWTLFSAVAFVAGHVCLADDEGRVPRGGKKLEVLTEGGVRICGVLDTVAEDRVKTHRFRIPPDVDLPMTANADVLWVVRTTEGVSAEVAERDIKEADVAKSRSRGLAPRLPKLDTSDPRTLLAPPTSTATARAWLDYWQRQFEMSVVTGKPRRGSSPSPLFDDTRVAEVSDWQLTNRSAVDVEFTSVEEQLDGGRGHRDLAPRASVTKSGRILVNGTKIAAEPHGGAMLQLGIYDVGTVRLPGPDGAPGADLHITVYCAMGKTAIKGVWWGATWNSAPPD